MSILPISNIINVSITNTPQGLAERNVNSLALFVNEMPANYDPLQPYGIYISPAQVVEDYGTSSKAAAMANAIFAQTPNIRTGNGRLVIIPMQTAVSATAGDVVTADLSSTLASIIAVTNGDIRVTINGVNYDLTGLNFTECTTWADIVKLLQSRLVNAAVTATANGFRIKSKKVGSTSTVALAQVPGGSGTDLSAAGYFKASTSTTATGANSTGETLQAAISRMEGAVSFTGVISNLDLENAAIEAVSDFIQAKDMIYLQHVASQQDILGIGKTIKDQGNFKTRILLHTASLTEANLFKAAYAGRAFSTNFNGSFTATTMNLKALATISPDTGITQTDYNNADVNGVDLYVSYDGVASVFSTGGNDYFDNPYNDLALKFALETAGFNFLRQTNTKVPQTEQGMNGLKTCYANVCERFIRNGCIAAGSWTSSETFGDPVIFKQNILDKGYYIYSLPIILQNPAEREIRKAPLVQIAIKRAGAIHTSDVIVVIND